MKSAVADVDRHDPQVGRHEQPPAVRVDELALEQLGVAAIEALRERGRLAAERQRGEQGERVLGGQVGSIANLAAARIGCRSIP
jgi:hypothetical protein